MEDQPKGAVVNLPEEQQAIINAAIALVQSGCTVVPTHKDGGKRPAVNWGQYQDAPPNALQVANWFIAEHHTGIGVLTGKASKQLEMIELEGRAVDAGLDVEIESLAHASGLGELYDRITAGWSEGSPSGGIHWFLRLAGGIVPGNTKLAANQTGEVLAETRGEGGFVVVAPSYGKVHETGLPWFVLEGGPATVATVTPDEREAFLDLFRALGVRKPPRGEEKAAPPASLVTGSTGDGTRPGDDYNLRASWDDLLIPAGWTKVYTTRDGVTHWRRPGKSEGTSATTGYGERGNLYLFTTSSDVFEAETSYSKFAAYALLHHHGDYAAAARALAAEGYGSPIEPSNPLVQAPHTDLAPTPVTEATEGQTEGTVDNREAEDSTWKPVNLTPYWRGTVTRPEAGVIHRADGPGLLYPGRVHSFYGESESGKSWLAQIAVATTLTNGGRAVYIDFEADADDIVSRLKLLGIREEHAANLTYLRPEAARSITDPYWQALLDTPTTLIVIDGVTEALTMWGGETKDNDTITTWTRKFPRALARATGAAVVTIDHVPKDKESRGRFAIGGQAKLASIDGCAYLIEPLEPLAPGKVGRLTVRVTKDRPGSIRAVAGMWRKMDRTQEATVAVLDASLTPIAYTFERPRTEEEVAQIKRDTLDHDIMRVILDKPGCGLNVINAEVTGDKRAHKVAIRDLIDSGYLVDEGTGVHGTPWILYPTRRGQEEFGNGQMVMRDVM